MKQSTLVVCWLSATILLLLGACAPTAMNTKDSGHLASDMSAAENPPPALIDIDENVYQNDGPENAILLTDEELAERATGEGIATSGQARRTVSGAGQTRNS